jgi:NAD(P)-dependent dehydrogenase (short-subunit alcohol dehydrogenase family)
MSSTASSLASAPSFEGRVALVTGGASGIGRAITEKLLASGARVAVWDVREDRLAELASRHGERVLTQAVDVSDKRQVDAAADLVQHRWGGIAHLVNNAGIIGKRMTLADLDADELDRVLSVNLKSVFYVTAAFAGRAGSFTDRSMVSMASIAARTGGMVGNMAYAATKGAIVTLTHAFSKELAPHVRINALAPGIIDTEIQLDSLGDPAAVAALADVIPLRRLGSPAEVAEAAVWLLSPASSYISASVLDVAGGR